MHRLPPIPKMAGATQSHAVADAAPGVNPNFAGFYAAQTLADVAPVSGPLTGLPQTDNPTRIAFLTADFNNDGHPDLATVDSNGGVAVAMNDGSGHFDTPVMTPPSPTSLGALGAVATDLNGDGFPDLVVLTQNSQLLVLTNQKNGAFTQTAALTLPNASTTQNLETGSFNIAFTAGVTGNSKVADIIAEYIVAPPPAPPGVPVAPSTLYRVTFLNDGAGGFSSAAQKLVSTTVATSSTLLPGRLILADVNHDGKPDLVTGIGSSATYMASYVVDVAMGNGDGTFAAPAANTVVTVPGDKSPVEESPSLLLTSLTRNASELDILIAIDNFVYYAAANGDGTYKTPVMTVQRSNFQSEDIASIEVEDFDGDGLPDMFVSGAGELTSYPGNGDGTFGKAVSSVVTNATDPSYPGVALADFDGDGKLDFVASSYQSKDVAFGKGLGGGKFIATPFLYTSTMPPDSLSGSTALDANGDGKTDLVCVNSEDGSLITALTGAGGAFTYKLALPASTTTYTYPQHVYGDFNGDGKPDLVVSLTTVGAPNVYGAGVALSNGDGTFQTPVPIQLPVSLASGFQYDAFAVGDVNGDGKLDLVITYQGDSQGFSKTGTPGGYLVALGNGDGTFHEATFVAFGVTPYYVVLDHFHGSKAPLDLVIADVNYPQVSNQQVSLLTGTGDGTFGSPTLLVSSYYLFGLLAVDFNKDGNPDLVVSAPENFTHYPSLGGFLAYTGHGDGTFSPSTVLAANSFPGAAIAADVNGDGNPDIVFSTAPLAALGVPLSVSGLSVLLGNGDGSFGALSGYPMWGTTLFAGNFLGDNTQSIVGEAAGSAFFMNQGGTVVTLASAPLTISAQVKPSLSGRPTPTGTVTFLEGTTVLGTGALANGAASVDNSELTVGTHTITFQYSGDANFQPNTASSTITVGTAPAPDFSISSSPASLSVTPGQTVKAQLTVAANAGLSGSVTFACSGLPAESTCSFAPASLTASPGQASTTTLSISTTAASSLLRTLARVTRGRTMTALAFLLIVPFCSGRRRQWLRFSLLIGVLTLSTVSIVGCGGGSSSSNGSTGSGSAAGSYTVTVTATSTSGGSTITHTLPLTVVIQ
ncbi:MAG TPA: FG-GAP-like repeat-containing protein [Edaphobacter sp.]